MKIEIKILNKEFYNTNKNHEECFNIDKHELPAYATPGSAGMDLVCTEDVTLYPGEVGAIHTGLAIWIGSGLDIDYMYTAALILPKSGLGTKGLVLANLVGLIDEDYQGELIVQAWNRKEHNKNAISIDGVEQYAINAIKLKAGDKFAQLTFVPIIKAQWKIVEEFSNETERGTGGFGSTGK